jgi:hypothetical protein
MAYLLFDGGVTVWGLDQAEDLSKVPMSFIVTDPLYPTSLAMAAASGTLLIAAGNSSEISLFSIECP